MKNMKKLFSLALALVMMMALVVTAGAQTQTGSITVSNPVDGETYTAYKIFDMTYTTVPDGEGTKTIAAYTLKSDS